MLLKKIIREFNVSNGSESRRMSILHDGQKFWLWDMFNDKNCDSLEEIADRSDSAVMDVIRDNGFELLHDLVTVDEDLDGTVRLLDFNNNTPVTYLWHFGQSSQLGVEYLHDTDTDVDERYCDLPEIIGELNLWDLWGTVNPHGCWIWDGKGNPKDDRGGAIFSIQAH